MSDAATAAAPAVALSVPAGETPATPVSKHKVKVDGQELEVPIDELIKGYQTGTAAHKRFREASAKEQQAQEFMGKLKAGELDPLIAEMGEDKFRSYAEKYLLNWLEYQNLPEDTRKAKQLEKELAAEKARSKEFEDKATADERAKASQMATEEIDVEITEALSAMGKKPTPRLVARIAEQMLAHLETQGSRLDAKTALGRSVGEIHHDIAEYLSDMPVDQLRELLPKEMLEALRKSQVELAISQDPMRASRRRSEPTSLPKQKIARMSSEQAFKNIERKFGG